MLGLLIFLFLLEDPSFVQFYVPALAGTDAELFREKYLSNLLSADEHTINVEA